MAGILQFSLGLATGSFVANAQAAQKAIGGVATGLLGIPGLGTGLAAGLAGFTSAHHFMEGVLGAFENGARLSALSKRTNESVSNLFMLEKGFKAVGLTGSEVPTVLFQMQKALGGFNELGEPTKDVFASIGLSVEEMKKLDAPKALEAILGQLARLGTTEATSFAAKIFGRGGAGDALQLARGMEEFRDALAKTNPQAAIFARSAEAFHKVEISMNKLKGISKGFFAGIAEGLAPGLQSALDVLNKIDLTGLGIRIGDALTAGMQAWKEGQFSDLVAMSMKSGMVDASNFMLGEIDKWGKAIKEAFNTKPGDKGDLSGWEKTKAGAKGIGVGLLGLGGLIGGQIGVPGAQENADKRIAQADELFGKIGWDGIFSETAKGIANASQDALGRIENPFKEQFNNLYGSLLSNSRFSNLLAKADNAKPKGDLTLLAPPGKGKAEAKPEVNALEKVGLLFGFGGRDAALDYARTTSQNTATMVTHLKTIADKVTLFPNQQIVDFTNK